MVRLIRRMLKTINHGDNKFQQVHRILILLTTEYPTSEQMDASWSEGTMAKGAICFITILEDIVPILVSTEYNKKFLNAVH